MSKLHACRISYIDIAKGIGILLMIIGHVDFGDVCSQFIHAFHMPLFIFISGFLFRGKHEKMTLIIKKKIMALIVPYLFWGLIQYPIWILIYHDRYSDLLEPLKNLLWCNTNLNMPIAGALWFLTCLFFVDVFFAMIYKMVSTERIRAVIIFVFVCIGISIPPFMSFRLPWALDVSFVGLGIYYLGYLTSKKQDVIIGFFGKSTAYWIIASVITIILIFVNGTVNLRTGNYAIVPLFWTNIYLSEIIILYWSFRLDRVAEKIINNGSKSRARGILTTIFLRVKSYLCFIGENSIVFLCLNQLCILISKKCWAMMDVDAPVVRLVIVLLASMVELTLLTYVIMHTKLKCTVGKDGGRRERLFFK